LGSSPRNDLSCESKSATWSAAHASHTSLMSVFTVSESCSCFSGFFSAPSQEGH